MIEIYGSSDNLIELEGDIDEEFPFYNAKTPAFLVFSDGTVLSIFYDSEGFWRINQRIAGNAEYSKAEATDLHNNYSDRVTLKGLIEWVVFGIKFKTRRL